MTGPLGNSEFCFLRISMFPSTSARETLRFEGNKIHCSPRDQSLSVYCFTMYVSEKVLKNLLKLRLILFVAVLNPDNGVVINPRCRYGWHMALLPSFLRFLLTFSTSANQYIKRWKSLAPKSGKYQVIHQVIFCTVDCVYFEA